MRHFNSPLTLAWILMAVAAFAAIATAQEPLHVGTTYTVVAGCTVAADPTTNNQPALAYHACDNLVAFMLAADSSGDLVLRQIKGHVVDVKVTVIR